MTKTRFRPLNTAASAILLAVSGGCLSLGGRTTHVHELPETQARLSGLESRVSALEQSMGAITMPEDVTPHDR